MDKIRQKSKKEKPAKNVDRSPLFISDVKAIKENLKIKEILRTVKMNSSMRIKAPRGSKVMHSKDFNDNEDFEELANSGDDVASEPPSATNPNVVIDPPQDESHEETDENSIANTDIDDNDSTSNETPEDLKPDVEITLQKSNSFSETSSTISQIDNESDISSTSNTLLAPSNCAQVKSRDRKLSLDQTMLARREGLSQSELDLHSIGMSPLERKSSFFRKKMDSFFKNTTEIFKRQSQGSKSPSIHRRGSMSISLQSLNDKTACNGECTGHPLNKNLEVQGSASSLQSSLATGHSCSSQSVNQSDGLALDGEDNSFSASQPALTGSQPIGDLSSKSVNSLNEIYIQESMMNSRAISMSSGLDSAQGKGRRKASRSNRVSWLASEGLTNYFRRQEEKTKDVHACYSYQDFSRIPEKSSYGPTLDTKGRRLSYQRAVSGEDPVLPVRYQDTLRRKPYIPENHVANYELCNLLDDLKCPSSSSFGSVKLPDIPEDVLKWLVWTEKPENFTEYLSLQGLSPNEEARQSVIRELICTEVDYIRYLKIIIEEVFMATLRQIQERGFLKDVDPVKLFLSLPDVANANLKFFETVLLPMIKDGVEKKAPFNTNLMQPAFSKISEMFQPYEKSVSEQTKALDYMRSLSASNPDFQLYLSWCHSQEICNRLQLSDILVKPMQRLTKYILIMQRLTSYTSCPTLRPTLESMEAQSKAYVVDINRTIRQIQETERLEELIKSIEPLEMDSKDEEIERIFRIHSVLNLKSPMLNCQPYHYRTLVHEADVRFKDSVKEIDVKAFILTDMVLICKKLPKTSSYSLKLIRPKYLLERLISYPRFGKNNELISISYVVLDDFMSSWACFTIYETSKDSHNIMLKWEQKFREAKLAYDYAHCYGTNPCLDLSELDNNPDLITKGVSLSPDDFAIDREARERVATMLHKKYRPMQRDYSMVAESFDAETSGVSSQPRLRKPMNRNSTEGSSRQSRLSSFQKSTSAASHDEPQAGPSRLYQAGTSVEHIIPPLNPDGVPTSITVNVVSECESDVENASSPQPQPQSLLQPQPPMLICKIQPSPSRDPLMRNLHGGVGHSPLLVHPNSGVVALMHSLPDLSSEPTRPRPPQGSNTQPAEKLSRSQQDLQKNRLSATKANQFLTPDHRGSSHPPPSPTRFGIFLSQFNINVNSRASLQRGLAFSYSFKYPPLSKMGHVHSMSQNAEAEPSTSQQNEATTSRGVQADIVTEQVSNRQKGASDDSKEPKTE